MANESGVPTQAELLARLEHAHRREVIQERQLKAFQEIGLALTSTLNLEPLLDRIVSHVARLLDADRCTLFILDRNQNELWAKVEGEQEEIQLRLPVDQGIAGHVALTGRVLNLKEARKHPRFSAHYDEVTGYVTRSMLCQPLTNYQRRIIGVIQVLNKNDGYFGVEDERLLEAVAAQAAMSIENSKLYLDAVGKNIELLDTQAQLRAKMEELDVLYRIEKELARSDDLDTLLASVVHNAIDAVPSAMGVVAVSEGSQEILTVCRGRDAESEQLREEAGVGLIGQVARTGRGVLLNAGAHDAPDLGGSVADGLDVPLRSLVCVPLFIKGSSAGALALVNRAGSPPLFGPEDQKLLTLIAAQTAKGIERARQRESQLNANRLATIGRLLSGVLHDFRTPMSIISGYAQLMSDETDPAERNDYAQSIRRQINMLDQMTREILAFARGERNLLIRKVQMHKFIDDVSELLREEFAGRGVELCIEQEYRGPIRMDETKIRRVVFNLARNAREAMPEGGTFTIRVDHDAKTEEVLFSFADSGGGIPEEIRDRLFASFVSSGKKDGTGLGLAIVKRIVDEHGGHIGFESETGVGTTFHIRLPREGRVSEPSAGEQPTAH